MFNNQTDYSRNKLDRNAIVYCDAFGQIVRLTKSDFKNEEEFLMWKAFSDEEYHAAEKEEHLYLDHKLAIHAVANHKLAVQAPEDMMMEFIAETERQKLRMLMMQGYKGCLTEIQQRRLWMYCVQGLDEYEIAGIEGVGQRRISTSIKAAKNKLRKFLKNRG